jgi:hypothetical protein
MAPSVNGSCGATRTTNENRPTDLHREATSSSQPTTRALASRHGHQNKPAQPSNRDLITLYSVWYSTVFIQSSTAGTTRGHFKGYHDHSVCICGVRGPTIKMIFIVFFSSSYRYLSHVLVDKHFMYCDIWGSHNSILSCELLHCNLVNRYLTLWRNLSSSSKKQHVGNVLPDCMLANSSLLCLIIANWPPEYPL